MADRSESRIGGAPPERGHPAPQPRERGLAALDVASTSGLVELQRAAGNRATRRLLRAQITKRRVGERGIGSAGGYEPGEQQASQSSPGGVEETKDGTLLFNFAVNSNGIKPEHDARMR